MRAAIIASTSSGGGGGGGHAAAQVLSPDTIQVVGAGRAECNGIYTPDGEWRGYRRWKHEHNNVWLRRGGDGWEWRWYLVSCRERASLNPYFYEADGRDNPVPPTHGWSNDGGGGASPTLFFGAATSSTRGGATSVQGMRTGVAKVMDGHRQMLARVQQGEATVDGCADQHRTRTHPHARRACVPPLTEPHLERLRCAAGLPMRSGILASVWWRRCWPRASSARCASSWQTA